MQPVVEEYVAGAVREPEPPLLFHEGRFRHSRFGMLKRFHTHSHSVFRVQGDVAFVVDGVERFEITTLLGFKSYRKATGPAGRNLPLGICNWASCRGRTRVPRFEKSGSAGNFLFQVWAKVSMEECCSPKRTAGGCEALSTRTFFSKTQKT